MTFKEVKRDYFRMLEIIGEILNGEGIYDFCGAFCNCEKFDKLLLNPKKSVAKQIMTEAIEYTSYAGASYGSRYGSQYCYNKELIGIFEKYSNDISTSWYTTGHR